MISIKDFFFLSSLPRGICMPRWMVVTNWSVSATCSVGRGPKPIYYCWAFPSGAHYWPVATTAGVGVSHWSGSGGEPAKVRPVAVPWPTRPAPLGWLVAAVRSAAPLAAACGLVHTTAAHELSDFCICLTAKFQRVNIWIRMTSETERSFQSKSESGIWGAGWLLSNS